MKENSGIAAAIAGSILGFFSMLAFVVAPLMFAFLFVYAIVKAFGPETAHASPTTVLVGVVAIVGALTVAFTIGLGVLGRSMTPRRRRGQAS
jgi:O-antigen/teichoic acid export membrane protein